jgi:ectoine hydroxylase-related dioxygenase (phytanoyl-CoA dioxygenase family)
MEGKVISMCLARGDVSFHHCRTIHGSGPNRSTTERLSLSVHLQDGDNAYQIDSAKDAKSHFNDMLCRKIDGQPDYSDPDICPVLWRET